MCIYVEIDRIRSSVTETVKFRPITSFMPPLGQVSVRAELVTQHRDATLVAIALQLYRRQHGMWPSELDALVPSLLPRVPRDRFDGGSIKYILRDGDPVLYELRIDPELRLFTTLRRDINRLFTSGNQIAQACLQRRPGHGHTTTG